MLLSFVWLIHGEKKLFRVSNDYTFPKTFYKIDQNFGSHKSQWTNPVK